MTCPNCRKKLTVEHLQDSPECSAAVASACGIYRVSKRKNPGRNGGRPFSDATRCACGLMTLKRALARKHVCEKETK